MNLTQQLITVLLAWSGIFIGYALVLIAPEENHMYQKHYKLMFATLFGLIFYTTFTNLHLILGIIAGILTFLWTLKMKKHILLYIIAGVLLGLSASEHLLMMAIYTFLLGLPAAAIQSKPYVKNEEVKKPIALFNMIAKNHALFLIAIVTVFV